MLSIIYHTYFNENVLRPVIFEHIKNFEFS